MHACICFSLLWTMNVMWPVVPRNFCCDHPSVMNCDFSWICKLKQNLSPLSCFLTDYFITATELKLEYPPFISGQHITWCLWPYRCHIFCCWEQSLTQLITSQEPSLNSSEGRGGHVKSHTWTTSPRTYFLYRHYFQYACISILCWFPLVHLNIFPS